MSDQKMELDNAIQLFQKAENFDEFKKGLSDVLKKATKTDDLHGARKRVLAIIDAKKADLMENNPDFKAIMERGKREAKQKAKLARAIHKAEMDEAVANAKTKAGIPDSDTDTWVTRVKHKIAGWATGTESKLVEPEELWCPIHRQKDTSNNIVNGEPTCMKCMHRRVPKSELKNFNRSYRRKWKKR